MRKTKTRMKTSKPYESILLKARKLAAMADPANGAAPAEIEAAEKALAELVARYHIKPDDLDESKREMRLLICKSRFRDQPPKLDKNLAYFARVCFAYIVGDINRKTRIFQTEIELPTRGLAVKMRQVHAVEAFCTECEYSEWKECFEHYAPDFIEMNDELRREKAQAAFNFKHSWSNFCGENDIMPPLPDAPEPTLADKLKAMSLPKAPKVSPWQKGGKLAGSNLLA